MKPNQLLIALFICLTASISYGQGIRGMLGQKPTLATAAPKLSPIAIIEMMEKKLGAEFQGKAKPIARTSSARILIGNKIACYGTILSSNDRRFSYLLFPADALTSSKVVIRTQDGKLHRILSGSPVQLLSRNDNLAIAKISYVEGSVNFKSNYGSSQIGSFVGILKEGNSWKTGAVTNGTRTAYRGIDAGTQRALSKHWARIGLEVNKRRSGYPVVIETDIDLDPEEAGSPLFDRSGKWHGITISRADQHSTYVIPASRVATLIGEYESARR